jgi:hypothetical protein
MHPMAFPDFCPAPVLNADFRPLRHDPLSLSSRQDGVAAVSRDRADIASGYDTDRGGSL